jgi:hypothetical protein
MHAAADKPAARQGAIKPRIAQPHHAATGAGGAFQRPYLLAQPRKICGRPLMMRPSHNQWRHFRNTLLGMPFVLFLF